MDKRGTDGSHYPGVCQRLFSFFLNPLSPRGFKPENMVNPTLSCPSSSDIPIEGSSRNGLNPEVLVDYGHDVGWFNDPTRYNNIWGGGQRKTPTHSTVKVITDDEKNNKTTTLAADQAQNTDTTKPSPLPPPPPPRRPRLLSVTSNVNEKAEAFIRRRREKMSRNYTLDLKKF
nr:uncharacterized protein LOC104823063 [Ipomoea batatas]